jgi:hypothetical protein
MLFALPAVGMREEREERRRTITERCEAAAIMASDHDDFAMVWCHLNEEGDTLARLIPDCVQVSGRDSDDAKEEKLTAFATGQVRRIVTKPSIGAWGLNFQHCNRVVTFPSHSFEQHYQSVRRCWRFGQTRPVFVDVVATEGESRILSNMQRKSEQADRMFHNLVAEMNRAINIERGRSGYDAPVEVPSWL